MFSSFTIKNIDMFVSMALGSVIIFLILSNKGH